jgi:hypothetical protein
MQIFTTLLAAVALFTVGIQANDDFHGNECNGATEGSITCSMFPPSITFDI